MLIRDKQKIDTYYQALLRRDSEFVGIFYVGVKTTKVFCIATCRARKPKAENVLFYSQLNDVVAAGFRPCKICRPLHVDIPPHIIKTLQLLQHDEEKISDRFLAEQGISPDAVRRWFKKHYKITFQTYQRMWRISQASNHIKQGHSVTDGAWLAGYESLSGFAYSYKKLMGKSPMNTSEPIFTHRFHTPLGDMLVCATEQGVCLLEFVGGKRIEREQKDLQQRLNQSFLFGENEYTRQAEKEIHEYFYQQRTHFDVPLHTPGTPFQQRIWSALQQLPYGQTTHYQALAQQIGHPDAVRAVAMANGANRVSIIIPCHRVIGKDGSLTGYGGGLHRKKWLLEHEQGKLTPSQDLFSGF